MKKKIQVFILTMIIMMFGAGITAYADELAISQTKATMNIGDTIDLDITGTDKTPVWYSYNKNIARVNSDGVVTAVRTGKTTIRARVGYTYKTCTINVVNSSVKLNKTSATIYSGGTSTKTVQLKATTSGATKNIIWKSSNEAVATVDSTGKVTSIAPGKTIITASANNKSATCNITVLESSISLNMNSLQLSTKGNGSSIKVTPTVVGSSKTVKWTTSDKNIATVSGGKVTGKKTGTATITATANGVSSNCEVNVITGSISIDNEQIILYAENPTIDTKVLKTNAGKKDVVTWASSNESVATVDNNGKVLAVGEGEAIIYASCYDTTDSCKVTVKKTSASILEDNVLLKTKGTNKTYTLNKTIVGKTTKQEWKSDNTAVVSVSNGKLTAKKAGTANITLTSNGKTDTVAVTVEDYDPTIKLNQNNYTLYTLKGNTITLKATVDGPSKTVTWTSSDESVATIKAGKVTALSDGNTTISATANGITATCNIEVLESKINLSTESITLDKGEKTTIGYDVTGSSQTVTWKTANSKVATIKNGIVTATGYGETDIKAIANGITSVCHVKVAVCEHECIETITKEATCGEPGIKTYTCSLCGDSYTEEIPATGLHNYEETEVVASTCMKHGTRTLVCTICNDVKTEELPLGEHVFSDWEVVIPASYTEKGIETRECEICKIKESRDIPVISHEHNYEWVIIAPTCSEDGYTLYTCNCGESYKDNYIDELNHDYGEWEIFISPDCENGGQKRAFCSRCDNFKTDYVSPVGHTREESSRTEPTCTQGGYIYYKCKDCGIDMNCDYIPATEHTPSDWITISEPDCINEGKMVKKCTICNQVLSHKYPDALGHDYEIVTTLPKCDEGGENYKKCKRCEREYHYHDYIPATGHDYEWVVIKEPTCTENGSRKLECKTCGYLSSDVYPNPMVVYATGHDYQVKEITKQPTSGVHESLSDFGKRTMECTVCQDSYEEYIINIDIGNGNTEQICGYFNDEEAKKTLPMVNELRESLGLSALTWDDSIEFITKIRSVEVVYSYDHLRPNGLYSYNTPGLNVFEENLCANASVDHSNGYYNTVYMTAERAIRYWTNSPLHYENMVNTGAETYNCSFFVDEHGETYCIQLFTGEEYYVPPTPHVHDEGEWVTTIEPSVGVEGKKELRCKACGEVLDTASIDMLMTDGIDSVYTVDSPDGEAQVIGHYGSDAEVQKMYELVNAYRVDNGKTALDYNSAMETVNRGSDERAVTSANYWEHWHYAYSENIAYTPVFYSDYDDMEMVQRVFDSWIGSEGHRNNILNAGSTKNQTAISVFYKKVDGGYERYWVQCFR